MSRHPIAALELLARRALLAAGASTEAAASTARGLIHAEAQGLGSHGLSRVSQYVAHLRLGRIDGKAQARVSSKRGATAIVDAADGLAFPACDLAVSTGIELARDHGVSFVAVTNSYHFGAALHHLEPVALAQMVGLALSNSPAAMAAPGGKRALLGTNPIAAIFPRQKDDPLAIDLALSEVARGKLMQAAKKGEPIPLGWALDEEGRPTTDPARGLRGSMAPLGAATGSPKGAMLALIIELLVTSFTGARLGFEADSFFEAEGNRPRIGQAFLFINPSFLGGQRLYHERIETLISVMLESADVRLPGARRYALRRQAFAEGIEIADSLLAELQELAA